jgi:flagella basal body P-ring formation protein FlgA
MMLVDAITSFFQRELAIAQSDLRLQIIHFPQLETCQAPDCWIEVVTNRETPTLGFQTLWLQVYQDGVMTRRVPITVDVTATVPVVVAARKIHRHEIVTPEMLTTRKMRVGREYRSLIRDPEEITGLMAKYVIPAERPLRPSMFCEAPDVKRGDMVSLKLVSNELVITTTGKARRDGKVGEEIPVICQPTGKPLLGTVQGPREVVVNLD